jgi:hypothetical protein
MFTTCTGSQYHACHAISVHFLRRFWWRHLIIPFWKSLTVPSGGELRWPQPPTILLPHILLWFGQKLIHAMAMAMALPWIKTIFELRFWSTRYNGEQKKNTRNLLLACAYVFQTITVAQVQGGYMPWSYQCHASYSWCYLWVMIKIWFLNNQLFMKTVFYIEAMVVFNYLQIYYVTV